MHVHKVDSLYVDVDCRVQRQPNRKFQFNCRLKLEHAQHLIHPKEMERKNYFSWLFVHTIAYYYFFSLIKYAWDTHW